MTNPTERKMATIRRISEIKPIDGADAIELAVVDGWKVVVKKGEYSVNQMVVFCEIDSFIPHDVAPFLTKNGTPKEYKGIQGNRLKTIKLRGQVSQGLILGTDTVIELFVDSKFDEGQEICEVIYEGSDVSDILGIIKWEPEENAQLGGQRKGNFPIELRKTDQERIQNLTKRLEEFKEYTWEVTEKLHGSSMTMYFDRDKKFHVCSRNVDLMESEDNSFWKIANKYQVYEKFLFASMMEIEEAQDIPGLAVQGELIGPGINGNQYGLSEADFYVFDMQHTRDQSYCDARNRLELSKLLCLKHTPVVDPVFKIPSDWTVDDLLNFAEGKSALNNSDREGLVFKCLQNPEISFKVVSNKWLLKNE